MEESREEATVAGGSSSTQRQKVNISQVRRRSGRVEQICWSVAVSFGKCRVFRTTGERSGRGGGGEEEEGMRRRKKRRGLDPAGWIRTTNITS